LIRSGPASAVLNMSTDEQMFRQYLRDGIPAFRVYSWKTPSLTYGVSQEEGRDLDPGRCRAAGVEIAGRMTGGGILFHDNEVTYSFVCAKEDIGEPSGLFVSYRKICAFLLRFYASLGLQASFASESKDFYLRSAPSVFCSASHEKYDILINGKKIGGNAQKRARQAIFQHGSIPISIDWKPALKCLDALPADIALRVTTLSQEMKVVPEKNILEQSLIAAFRQEFNVLFADALLNPLRQEFNVLFADALLNPLGGIAL